MREIKFRAWDKKYQRMSKVSSLDFKKGIIYTTWWEENKDRLKKEGTNEISDMILMQFTGLKDNNCKDIYEGDIVKTYEEYYPIKIVNHTIGIINDHDGDWEEWYCGFDLGVPNDEYRVLHYQLTDKVEVVGNIYENPELIK